MTKTSVSFVVLLLFPICSFSGEHLYENYDSFLLAPQYVGKTYALAI